MSTSPKYQYRYVFNEIETVNNETVDSLLGFNMGGRLIRRLCRLSIPIRLLTGAVKPALNGFRQTFATRVFLAKSAGKNALIPKLTDIKKASVSAGFFH